MAEFLLEYQLNIYAIVLMSILWFSLIFKSEIYRFTSRLIIGISITIIVMLIIEILSWTFDGIDEPLYRSLNITFNWLFFVIGPAAPGLMTSYVDYLVNGDIARIKKRVYYLYPFFFNILLGVINLFTPIISSVSADNVYQREFLMPLGFIPTYLLLIYCLYMIFKNRTDLTNKVVLSVTFFLVMPITGAIFQMLYFGLKIMWAMLALGLIVAYIFTEMVSAQRDYLTRLYTREITTDHINRLIEKNLPFTLLIFDINDLKIFNDTHGHRAGDLLLIHFAKLLEIVYGDNAVVSRFGGDEFVIVSKEYNPSEIERMNQKLIDLITTYRDYDLMQRVVTSIGYEIRNTNSPHSLDELYHLADKKMYENKSILKADKGRRKTDQKR